jgi:hypothetical protein
MKKVIRYFNLIEIVLSLGVIAFGITSVMAVFPIALKNVENSIGEDGASNVSDIMNSFLGHLLKDPNSYSTGDTITSVLTAAGIPSTQPDGDIDFQKEDLKGEPYKIVDKGAGEFQVTTQDLNSVVCVWYDKKQKLSMKFLKSDGTQFEPATTPQDYIAGLYIEVSWPAEIPYSAREKRLYYRTVSALQDSAK